MTGRHTAIQERTHLGGRGCGRSASILGGGTSDRRRGTPPPSTRLGSARRPDKARVSGDLRWPEPLHLVVSTCTMINIASSMDKFIPKGKPQQIGFSTWKTGTYQFFYIHSRKKDLHALLVTLAWSYHVFLQPIGIY